MKTTLMQLSTALLLSTAGISIHAQDNDNNHDHRHDSKPKQHRVHPAAAPKHAPVVINSATIKQLASIKGVGEKRAERIVNYRDSHGEFTDINQLVNISGISNKSLQRIIQNNPGRLRLN